MKLNNLDTIQSAVDALHSLPTNGYLIKWLHRRLLLILDINNTIKQLLNCRCVQIQRARRLFTECRSIPSRRALYIGWSRYRRESRAPRSPALPSHSSRSGFFPHQLYNIVLQYISPCVHQSRHAFCSSERWQTTMLKNSISNYL